MNDPLNPYEKWLGLSTERPDYFQLLGLPRGVVEPEKLEAAAKKALRRLASQSPEERNEAWHALQEEIKRAYHCLAEPVSRSDYLEKLDRRRRVATKAHLTPAGDDEATVEALDLAELRDHSQAGEKVSGASEPPLPMAEVVPQPPSPPASPPQSPPTPQIDISSARSRSRPRSSLLGLVIVLLLLFAVGGSATWGVWYLAQGGRLDGFSPSLRKGDLSSSQPGSEQTASSPAPQTSPDSAPTGDGIDEALQAVDEVGELAPKQPEIAWNTKPAPPDEPSVDVPNREPRAPAIEASSTQPTTAEQLELVRHMEQIWFGMRQRDWAWVTEKIKAARRLPITQEATGPLQRLLVVAEEYHALWKEMEKIARSLAALQEFQLNGTIVVVTEAKSDELVCRSQGVRWSWPYQLIPNGLALAAVSRGREPDDPDRLLAECVFYAVAAREDVSLRKKALERIDIAASKGLDVDSYRGFVTDNYRVLALNQVTSTPPELDEATVAWIVEGGRNGLPDSTTIPEEATDRTYELLRRASETADPEERYVLLATAIGEAEDSGDAFVLLEALDEHTRYFGAGRTDYLKSMQQVAEKSTTGPPAQRSVQVCLELADRRQQDDVAAADAWLTLAEHVAGQAGLEGVAEAIRRQKDPAGKSGAWKLSF